MSEGLYMPKAVLDTNIWLSGIFWEGNPYKLIKLAEQKKVEVFVSNAILEEIVDVLNRERKFKKYMENFGYNAEELIKTILDISKLTVPKERINIIKEDPDDNRILECAVSCNADYIISGDKHLLNLKEFQRIKIVKAREFLDILDKK